jgi:uncharacterized membrane protein
MKWLFVICALLFALPASATTIGWPALYDVSDVAADDVLNVREAPNAGAAIIGTLSPNATNIEIIRVDEDENWGLINTGEQSGWVSLRFMTRLPDQWDGHLPRIAQCFGTEPFWSFRIIGDGIAEWSTPESTVAMTVDANIGSANRYNTFATVGTFTQAPHMSQPFSYVLRTESCNDGMSDRNYGYSIDFLMHPSASTDGALLSGCCTLSP